VHGAHLGVAGEEAEGAAVGDLQHAAGAFGGLREVVGIARVGHSGRQIEQRLARIVEVRGDDQLARQGEAEPPGDVLEAGDGAARLVGSRGHGERGGGEHDRVVGLESVAARSWETSMGVAWRCVW